jgi:hypothetical protein
MNIPQQITAGDSLTWTDGAIDGASSGFWTLAYVLRGSVGLTLTAAASGDGWLTTLTRTQSQTLVPGSYSWQATITNGDQRRTLGSGTITVLADLAYSGTASAYDGRSQSEQDLEAVRAAMRAQVSGGAVQEYSIGSRSLKKMAMADLIALESKLKADVARDKRRARLAAGLDSGRAVFVRF